MKKEITYADVCKAFGNFSESEVKNILDKSTDKEETLEGKAERLSNKLKFFAEAYRGIASSFRYFAEKSLEQEVREKIEEEKRRELKKAFFLLSKLHSGLQDVSEYLNALSYPVIKEAPEQAGEAQTMNGEEKEKLLSGVEKMIEDSLSVIVETAALADSFAVKTEALFY